MFGYIQNKSQGRTGINHKTTSEIVKEVEEEFSYVILAFRILRL